VLGEVLKHRVVITGYGMITPLGVNAEETFENCRKGKSGIDYITAFDAEGLPCQIAGQIKDDWIEEFGELRDKRLVKFSSRGSRLMNIAVKEASLRARLQETPDRERIGVSLGSYGENPSLEDIIFLHRFYDGHGHWDLQGLTDKGGYNCLNFYRRKPDIGAALLSILFDCRGTSLSIASACSAGAQAVGEAFRIIQDGRCDVMIAGGCEAALTLTGFIGFVLIGALAERYRTPQEASRPFDRKRNGFVLSEGAAAVILEDYRHACERGAPIFGEILGYGASADAYRITDTHPDGEGAVLAMRKAVADAALDPEDIDYINAHGTSTVKNDSCETKAIKEVFGARAYEIPISSNKSMLGHSIAASGPIELILTLMGMNRSIILPTINQEFPDPKCDLWFVPNEAVRMQQAVAICNSFGFGGQNACLCIGKE